MRYIFMTVIFILALVCVGQAQAGDWIEKTWCVEVQGDNYCLEFERGVTGPGLRGDVTLTCLPADAVVGPADEYDAGQFSQPDPDDNGPITLYELDLKARINGDTMILYDNVLKLRSK
jgi:hypothetical protein